MADTDAPTPSTPSYEDESWLDGFARTAAAHFYQSGIGAAAARGQADPLGRAEELKHGLYGADLTPEESAIVDEQAKAGLVDEQEALKGAENPVRLTPAMIAQIQNDIQPDITGPSSALKYGLGAMAGDMLGHPEQLILPEVRAAQALRMPVEGAVGVLGRMANTGLAFGGVNAVESPFDQANRVAAGMQPEGVSALDVAKAAGEGFVGGAVAHGAFEGVGRLAKAAKGWVEGRIEAARKGAAAEDPSLRSATDQDAPQPAPVASDPEAAPAPRAEPVDGADASPAPSAERRSTFELDDGTALSIERDGHAYVVRDEAGNQIAEARVRAEAGEQPHVSRVEVAEDYRRKGVATALYNQIEGDLGAKLSPDPNSRTPDADAFWAARGDDGGPTAFRDRHALAASLDHGLNLARRDTPPTEAESAWWDGLSNPERERILREHTGILGKDATAADADIPFDHVSEDGRRDILKAERPAPPIAAGDARYVQRGAERYIARANGSDVLGEITPEIADAVGREAAPIRLPEGTDRAGEKHIEARHGAEIRGAGYPDAASFVSDVAADFTEIYRGRGTGLFLVKRNGATKVAVVELRPVGETGEAHWSVETAALYRPDFFDGKKLLWRRPGPDVSPPSGGSPFHPGGQSGPIVARASGEGQSIAKEAGHPPASSVSGPKIEVDASKPRSPFFYPDDGKGGLLGSVHDGELRVAMSGVENPGEGYGAALYTRAAEYAQEHGLTLTSDSIVSPEAQRMYAGFRERGFDVEENPAVTRDADGVLRSTDPEEPVFKVRGERSAPAVKDGMRFRREAPKGDAGSTGGEPGPEHAASDARLLSLHQQSEKLAEELDQVVRAGRVQGGKTALGQYDAKQDVIRVRSIADFPTVAHEVAHAIEARDPQFPAFIRQHAAELGPLDYDGTRKDPAEGFAEFVRYYLTNPAFAQRAAPQFSAAFENVMRAIAPDTLDVLQRAGAAFKAYEEAKPGEKLAAFVRKPLSEFRKALASVRGENMAQTIGLVFSKLSAFTIDKLTDDKNDVARAVRSIVRAIHAETGTRVRLEGADNPENLVRLFGRNAQAAGQDMLNGVRPYRGVAPEGPSLREALEVATGQPGVFGRWNESAVHLFNEYLVARRAEVLYRKFEAGEMPNRPVPMSRDQVIQAIGENEANFPAFRAGADLVHEFTRQLLRKQYEGGLINRELFDKLMGEEFYVPLFRHMDDKPSPGGVGGADGPGQVATIRGIKGSDRDVIPPLQGLMTQTFLVNRTLQHNDIIKSLVALARRAQAAGAKGIGRILEEVSPSQIMGQSFDLRNAVTAAARRSGMHDSDIAVLTGALTDVFGHDPIMGSFFRKEPAGKRGEPIVFYKEGGELRAVRLISKDEGMGLYEAVSGLPPVAHDIAIQLGAAAASALRVGVTTNPVFAITNFLRDQVAATILRPDFIPFAAVVKAPFKRGGLYSELKQDQWAQMYVYGGGVSPGAGAVGLSEMVDRDINALARKGWHVQKLSGIGDLTIPPAEAAALALQGDFRGAAAKLGETKITGAAKALAEIVEASETATRLEVFTTVFKQKKRQGLSDYDAMIEAAAQATDLMDFGRHGSGLLYFRTIVPFLNAHLQGLAVGGVRTMARPLWRAATEGSITEADAAALKNSPLALFKTFGVLGAAGYMYGLYQANNEAYRDASPELRASHLIIPGENGKIGVAPKSFELAMGFNLGEMLALHMATGDPRAAGWAMDGIREVLEPPLIPQIVRTSMELALNRSLFTGRDIVPEKLQNKENPQFEVKPTTSVLARRIGKAINISPIKVDYAIGGQFGMWGKDLLALSNTVDPDEPASASEDTMFVRRFIKSADRLSETTKTWWNIAAQHNGTFTQANQHYSDLLKSFKDQEASQYLGSLKAEQKAFVILNSAGTDEGKPAFTADAKRINPLTRAATAVSAIKSMSDEFQLNAQKEYETGERVQMDPRQRRDAIDSLRQIAALEQRNALVIMKQPGYEDRRLLSVEDEYAVLKAKAPEVAKELATRYATAKVLPTDVVAKAWPEAQQRLLQDGSQADLTDLVGDAKGAGWAFEGTAVKRPQKRRTSIPAAATP